MGGFNTMGNTCTFTAPSGKKFTSIVINFSENFGFDIPENYGFVWYSQSRIATWSGDATTSVSFSGYAADIITIVFYLTDVD